MNARDRHPLGEPLTSLPALYPSGTPIGRPSDPAAQGSVAVIMRTKNRPLLLRRALHSVLAQTHRDWRLYLVNDGGDRGALERLLDDVRAAFENRLVVVHHDESRGMENASNAGLSLATQEFAVVHDDDDSWEPGFLAATTEFLARPQHAPCVAVTTGCYLIEEMIDADTVLEVKREVWKHNQSTIDLARLLKQNLLPPICLLFRRAAIDRIGPFNGSMPVLGDWDFNIRLMLLGEIDFLPDMLANYHHRVPGSGGDYGNTVVEATALHVRQKILYRNSLLRAALSSRPDSLGAVQATLHAIAGARPRPVKPPKDRSAAILKRLANLEAQNKQLERSINRLKRTLAPPPPPVKPKPKPTLFGRIRRLVLRPAHWLLGAASGPSAPGPKPRG